MFLTKQHMTRARTLGVAIVATLALAACATKDDIAAVNSRIDQLDSRVQSAAQSAESANQSAQRANRFASSLNGPWSGIRGGEMVMSR